MWIFITNFFTYFTTPHRCAFQKFFGSIHTYVRQITDKSMSCLLAENRTEMIWTDIHLCRNGIQ